MIILDHVNKKYKKYTIRYNSFKSFILHFKQYLDEQKKIDYINVIEDLSLTIPDGEVLCIAGANGCGKSTLAKLLAGTIAPDSGKITVEGSVVPFLELGVAFNSELSGKDNVILNGILLGMSRSYLKANMDKIFEFAEIQDFMNTPIKFYSSGMVMRLAYAIGMHANGDIYIFDEILAVGDASFQEKCFKSFNKLVDEGKTIILITHDINTIKKYATKVLLLKNKTIIDDPQKISELTIDSII